MSRRRTGLSKAMTAALVALYALCIFGANWLIRNVGNVVLPDGTHLAALGPLLVPSGTFAAGLTLVVRDVAQRQVGRTLALAMIIPGVLLTALLDVQLAVASGAAFALSELLDFAIYTRLQKRGLVRAVAAASAAGAVLDSLVFLTLAGIPLAVAMPGQVSVKWAVMLLSLPLVTGVRRWLPARDPV
jgi:uncharacterized PurR-regulated membrane protein YhhQ (DUF165 family)